MTNVVPLPRAGHPAASDVPFDREVSEPPPAPLREDDRRRGGPPPGGSGAGVLRQYGRVVPLGTASSRGRKAYVFLDADGERQMFTARDLVQRANLLSLFGGAEARDLLVDLWPEPARRRGPADFEAEAAGAELMSACGAIGSAEAIELRLDGVWPLGDGLLVNCGDVILTDEGEHPPGFRDGTRIYVAARRRAHPPGRGEGATPEEVAEIAAALNLWTFAEEHRDVAPQVLLGVLACGLLGIAIPWRPHVFLRGEMNAGKSSLARLIAYACGAGEPADDLTQAGLRRLFNARSGLIPLDEREQDAQGVAGVVRIMRGASDGDGNVTIQADPEGGGTAIFRVAGCFLMSATTLPALTTADASRITVLQVRRGAVDRRVEVEAAQARAKELHPRLLRRMLDAWPRWHANWQAAREAAGALDATSRSMDQVGALLAGWWTLTEDAPLTPRVAAQEMARFAALLTTRADAAGEGNGQLVLQHLLGSRIVLAERTSDQVTVQAALDRAARAQAALSGAQDGEYRDSLASDVDRSKRQLGASGLFLNVLGQDGRGWPWPFEGRPEPGLLIATELPAVRALFHGSDWPKTGWREPLRDLPGVRVSRRSMKFPAGGPSRAVFVPLGVLGISDDDLAEPV